MAVQSVDLWALGRAIDRAHSGAMRHSTEIAIVGAGAAGVAAARRLADRGRDVLLIDALDRIGGRAWTRGVDGHPLDLGCGWLHSAERNPWVAVAEARSRTIDRTPPAWREQFRNLGFSAAEQEQAGAAFGAFSDRLRRGHPSDRAADLLSPDCPWNGFIEALSSYINGAQLGDLSIADYLAYDDAASEANWRLPAGYGALVEAEAAGLPTALGTMATAIAHEGAGVRVETSRGPIAAQAAIVTISSDVLASGALRLPRAFDPAIEAATRLPLGLADKMFLSVAQPEALPVDGHLIGDPREAATGSYHLRPFGRPIIECFFGGAAARALEAEGGRGAEAFAIEELGKLLGAGFARGLHCIARSAWAQVPSIRGSYSHALPGHADARSVLAARRDERILLAGEACSAQDFSTAHGARETGLAAADALERVPA